MMLQLVGLLTWAIGNMLLRGWAVMLLWNWFVPLPRIAFWHAMGLVLIVALFHLNVSMQLSDIAEKLNKDLWRQSQTERRCYFAGASTVGSLLSVAIGWLYQAL